LAVGFALSFRRLFLLHEANSHRLSHGRISRLDHRMSILFLLSDLDDLIVLANGSLLGEDFRHLLRILTAQLPQKNSATFSDGCF